jgi:hypothetical protein
MSAGAAPGRYLSRSSGFLARAGRKDDAPHRHGRRQAVSSDPAAQRHPSQGGIASKPQRTGVMRGRLARRSKRIDTMGERVSHRGTAGTRWRPLSGIPRERRGERRIRAINPMSSGSSASSGVEEGRQASTGGSRLRAHRDHAGGAPTMTQPGAARALAALGRHWSVGEPAIQAAAAIGHGRLTASLAGPRAGAGVCERLAIGAVVGARRRVGGVARYVNPSAARSGRSPRQMRDGSNSSDHSLYRCRCGARCNRAEPRCVPNDPLPT